MPPGGPDKLPLQRFHPVTAMLPGGGEQFLHGLPRLERRCARRQRPAETHRHRMGNARRQFPHEMSLFEARRAAQHAVERHRHDGRVHVLHDALHAALERQQLADARDLPLGENADDLAVADGVAGGLKRVEHFARTLFGGDRDDAQDARAPVDPGLFINFLQHQETDRPVGGSDEQQRIHPGNVVADEQRAALFRDIVAPDMRMR